MNIPDIFPALDASKRDNLEAYERGFWRYATSSLAGHSVEQLQAHAAKMMFAERLQRRLEQHFVRDGKTEPVHIDVIDGYSTKSSGTLLLNQEEVHGMMHGLLDCLRATSVAFDTPKIKMPEDYSYRYEGPHIPATLSIVGFEPLR